MFPRPSSMCHSHSHSLLHCCLLLHDHLNDNLFIEKDRPKTKRKRSEKKEGKRAQSSPISSQTKAEFKFGGVLRVYQSNPSRQQRSDAAPAPPPRSHRSLGLSSRRDRPPPPEDDLDRPPEVPPPGARGFLLRCFGAAASPSLPSASAFAARRSRRDPSPAPSRRFGSPPPDPFPLVRRGRSALPPASPPPWCSSPPHPACEGSGSFPLAVPGEALNSFICSTPIGAVRWRDQEHAHGARSEWKRLPSWAR